MYTLPSHYITAERISQDTTPMKNQIMSTIVLQIFWKKRKNPENVAALPLPDVQDGLANLVLEALVQHPKADTNLSPTTSSYGAAWAILILPQFIFNAHIFYFLRTLLHCKKVFKGLKIIRGLKCVDVLPLQ